MELRKCKDKHGLLDRFKVYLIYKLIFINIGEIDGLEISKVQPTLNELIKLELMTLKADQQHISKILEMIERLEIWSKELFTHTITSMGEVFYAHHIYHEGPRGDVIIFGYESDYSDI